MLEGESPGGIIIPDTAQEKPQQGRARKLARKKMQREGLLPMKPGWSEAAPATDRGKRIPGRSARTARSIAQLSTPARSSP
jgi:hypothetical protein